MKKQLCYFILPISFFAISSNLSAEIVTDGSLGPQVSINGPNFLIGEDLGSRAGNNLFHSFNTFNINPAESATFTGASDIANVISRVTGGSASSIDGLLESQVGNADFYFINPAGIIFGQNAQINVPAAFHASTAKSLNFSDGFQFDAANPDSSSLSVATPSSFGFTHQQTAKIVMDGSLISSQNEQHLSFTSSELEADSAQIYSESGIVSMVATGSNNTTVALDQPLLEQNELNATGSLKLINTQIDVSGNGGGQINIAAGDTELTVTDLFNTNTGASNEVFDSNIMVQNLEMDNTWIKNDSTGAGESPSINLLVENNIELFNGSILSSSAFAEGDAGNVFVSAINLKIDRRDSDFLTGIVSNANNDSSGNAGLVEIQLSGALEILNQSEIGSNTFAAGNAGVVLVEAASIYIDGKNTDGLTGISSQATSNSSGQAGFIDIKVSDSFEIFDSGIVSTSTFSEGNAGDINILTNNLYINRFDANGTTGIFSNSSGNSTGNAGEISITSNDWIAVVNGGKITSSTFAGGNAGDIKVNTKQLFLDDTGSPYLTGIISNAESGSVGDAGNLDINVTGLTEIYSSATIGSNTFSSGDAGTVNIHSGEILIDDLGANSLTGIVSQTNSTGHAGELNITVDGLFTLQNGGEVSTNTFGQGNAGTINIKTSEITIDNLNSEILTGIVSNSDGTGYAGSVNLNVAKHANIINGGQIASSAFGEGDAGEVKVNADTMTINRQDNSSITGILSNAQEDSLGAAGTVSVEVTGLLQIINGGKIVSNTSSIGDAGSVSVKAGDLYLDTLGSEFFTGISSNAEFGSTGNAGFVNVDVSGLTTILSAAEIGSNTFADGDAGEIRVHTGQLLIDTVDTRAITGIFSDAISGSNGNAGLLNVTVDDTAILQNGGKIGSNTYSSGNAGDINLKATNLIIDGKDYPFDTGVTSIAKSQSSGNAGSINIQVSETLTINGGGEISTNTVSSGNAGLITVNAKNINIDREDNDRFTGIFSDAEFGSSGHAGSLRVTVTDSLNIINGAWLSSNTESTGNAGDIEIISNSINLDANSSGILTGIFSDALDGSSGDAGSITINNSDTISIINGASIASITEADGNAGMVALQSGNLFISLGESMFRTGVFSDASPISTGNAGFLDLNIDQSLQIIKGGNISSTTFGYGDAGSINLVAGNILMDGQGARSTGIFSSSESLDMGKAGAIDITVNDTMTILDGAAIGSNTFSKGNAGFINLKGKNLVVNGKTSNLFTGIASQAGVYSTGNAGFLNIDMSNQIDLINGGKISTNTFALGNAGDIQIKTKNLKIDRQANQVITTGVFSNTRSTDEGDAGSIDIQASGDVQILGGGEIASNTYSNGDAGQINIASNNLLIDYQQTDPDMFISASGIFSDAKQFSEGHAGSIFMTINETLKLSGNANISSNTNSIGHAGNINIASGNLVIDAAGSIFSDEIFSDNLSFATGISSDAKFNSNGNAGSINITNQDSIQILNGARISSDTQAYGDAGDIDIKSGSLEIIRNDANFNSQISSNASEGAFGNAGYVSIFVDHSLYINDGNISSDVQFVTMGNAGDIDIQSNGSILLENGGFISSSTFGEGNSGNIEILTDDLQIDRKDSPYPTGIFTESFSTGSGSAGFITVNAENNINIINGGQINSNTISEGDAGVIQLRAENIVMDRSNSSNFTGIFSDAKTDSGGNAGSIQLFVDKQLTIKNGAWISSNTESIGNAGDIEVSAHDITFDAQDSGIITGILSNAKETSSGDAGQIEVTAPGLLEILGGAEISSNTESSGNAGTININAGYVLIDTNDSNFFTGIFSQAEENSQGNAGQLDLIVQEELTIFDAGKINTNTDGLGNAGDIQITAKNITIDRQGGFSTGVFSDAKENSEGHAGSIQLNVTEQLNIHNGAWISSNTEASGDAGDIVITANNISLDAQDSGIITGVLSNAKETSSGDAGQIKINAPGLLEVLGGAEISSNTESIGNAGEINIEAGDIKIDTQGSSFITGVFSNAELNSQGNAGQLIFNVQNDIEIIDGGVVSTNTDGLGNAGDIDISTSQLLIDRKSGFATGVFSNTSSTKGDAGSIKIEASDTVSILSGGEISSNTFSIGNAGVIYIQAKNLNIERQDSSKFTGIFSDAKPDSEGNAGSIYVVVTDNINLNNGHITSNTGENSLGHAGQILITSGNNFSLSNSAEIGSNTNAKGDAGEIVIKAKNLYLNGKEAQFRTGIFSNAEETSSGNAGTIQIDIEELLSIVNGSAISSNTYAVGDAGDIKVDASTIILDGEDSTFRTGISSNAEDTSSGNAGFIQISSSGPMHIVSGARVSSDTYSVGNAGNIIINADSLLIDTEQANFSAGIYSSAKSSSSGNAGAIQVTVNDTFDIHDARISSDADEGSSGHAGFIELKVGGTLSILKGAEIGSNTEGLGNAGDLSIRAENILIDQQTSEFFTGIGSDTFDGATGDAGQIDVLVDKQLKLINGGQISSSTYTSGNAGTINIQAKDISIEVQNDLYTGISSSSNNESISGQVGNIFIQSESLTMNDGAAINISSTGTVESAQSIEQTISIDSGTLAMEDGSVISAKSSGNSPAANIKISTSDSLTLNSESSITTESVISNAGEIQINSGLVSIDNSLITTSVSGELGNGGDISITTPALIMKTGFIQGNTAATGASGGDILIDTPQLIFPSNQVFLTNQDDRIDFQPNTPQNVIQAAAPDGVSGNVTVTAPTLDLSSSILNISTRFSEQTKISKNPCKVSAGEIPSSLTWAGQGGLPTSHSDSINLPLGKRLLINEQPQKQNNDQSGVNQFVPPKKTNNSKLDCVALN